MLRRLSLLNDRKFYIRRFHQFSHKCTKYKADLIFDVPGVYTGAVEQRFKLLRPMAGLVMNMNELNWIFHVDMALFTLNELWLNGGVAREMHCRYVEPSAVQEDPRKPETWASERPGEVSLSSALQGCVLHLGKKAYRHAAWCAPPTPEGSNINQDLTDTPHPMAALAFQTPNRVPAPLRTPVTPATPAAQVVLGTQGETPAKVAPGLRFVSVPFTAVQESLLPDFPRKEWEFRDSGGEDKGFQKATTKAVERDGTYDSTFLTTAGKVLERLQGLNLVKVSDVVHSIRTVPEKTSYTMFVPAQHFGLLTIIVPTRTNSNPAYVRGKHVAYVVRHPAASLTSAGLDFLRLVSITTSDWDGLAGKEAKTRKRRCTDSPDSGQLSPPRAEAVPSAASDHSTLPAV